MVTKQLQEHANELLRHSVGARTRDIYGKHVNTYIQFHNSLNLGTPFRLKSLRCFIAHLHKSGSRHSSVLSNMAALKYHCRLYGIANDLDSQVLKMTIRGVRNSNFPRSQPSRVITVTELGDINRMANSCFFKFEATLVRAVMTTAFFGFLRVSEYTKTCAGHSLLISGCDVSASKAVITIPSSKFGNTAVKLALPAQKNKYTCPIYNLRRYLSVRPKNKNDQLFLYADGKPISDDSVRRWLRVLCMALHTDVVTPHALRIGGATWAASQGWPDSVIRSHGRWKSDAFLQYIRPC